MIASPKEKMTSVCKSEPAVFYLQEGEVCFLQYQTSSPIKYDIGFRRFVNQELFGQAILIPVRSGVGRKFTTSGVVKVLGPAKVSSLVRYLGCFDIHWAFISERFFENQKREQSTKLYFRGFDFSSTKEDISRFFTKFGALHYIYIMDDSATKPLPYRHGYVIFEKRSSVESLMALQRPLLFRNHPIHFEEYKSKSTKILESNLSMNFRTNFTSAQHQYIQFMDRGCLEGPTSRFIDRKPANIKRSLEKIKYNQYEQVDFQVAAKINEVNFRPYLRHNEAVQANTSKYSNVRFNRLRPAQFR